MITIPATEFSKNVGQYREIAQREPVAITSHDRIANVLLSGEEYEHYRAYKKKQVIEKLNAEIQIGLDQAARGEFISAEESKLQLAEFKKQFLASRE
jgi:PHD/YefM family antitoxin component YafN of YafNO toxin-antitoxin module